MFAVAGCGEEDTFQCQGAGATSLWQGAAAGQGTSASPAGRGAPRPGMACLRQVQMGPVPSHPVLRDRTESTGE